METQKPNSPLDSMDKNIVVDKIFLSHPQIWIIYLTFFMFYFKYNPQMNFN